MGFVYILSCTSSHGSKRYVGSTMRPLEQRLREHFSGQSRFTAGFDALELICALEVPNNNARAVERYLKNHRRASYDLAAGRPTARVGNFYEWCAGHAIPARKLTLWELFEVEDHARQV